MTQLCHFLFQKVLKYSHSSANLWDSQRERKKINQQWNKKDNHICGLLVIKKNVFSKVASRWHSTFGLSGKRREWENRAGRGGERDLFVSFVFLLDWSPSVVWLWERTRGKCSLTAGVRLLLDKIICGGEEVALFCVCVCVCTCTSTQCVLLLIKCLPDRNVLCSFGTQYNTEVVFDLHTVLHMVTGGERQGSRKRGSSCSES